MSERKVPMRRCVGCMTSFPKTDVVRFVCQDGKIEMDPSGRKNGRGVYLCRSLECFDAAIKKKRLNYALKVSITPDEAASLREDYAKELSSAEVLE